MMPLDEARKAAEYHVALHRGTVPESSPEDSDATRRALNEARYWRGLYVETIVEKFLEDARTR